MNMKTLVILILVGISYASFAQDAEDRPADQGNRSREEGRNNQSRLPQKAQDCIKSINQAKLVAANPNNQQLQTGVVDPNLKECQILDALANTVGSNIAAEPNQIGTARGDLVCKSTAGYTLDYPSCEAAIKALNVVVNTESAMLLQQQIRTDLKQKSIQEKTVKQAAVGNLTTGVFDASIESNKHQKAMEQEKALAYAGAVAALGKTYSAWKKPETMIANKCSEAAQSTMGKQVPQINLQGSPVEECMGVANRNIRSLTPNEAARSVLAARIADYIAKGLAAGIKMNQFDTAAKTVEAAKDQLAPDDEDAMMERCMFNPTDPACSKNPTRTPGQTFKPGDFSLGGGGNNSFTMDPISSDFGEEGEAPTVGNEVVAGTNSPFLDEAKAANGIVDPAAAAQLQPTGGAGGGGGGVGGGGGGGSASLGGDLDGASKDGDKDPSLKTSKSSGNYAFGAGGGYSAVKGGKDDANPFASLFDSKSSGGIEEDRSIASGDIDGSASGLFQKISNRYNAVKSQNRIEANNLE